jgi:hypothetical protein
MELSNKCASKANNGKVYGLWIATRRLNQGVHQNGAVYLPHHGNDRAAVKNARNCGQNIVAEGSVGRYSFP